MDYGGPGGGDYFGGISQNTGLPTDGMTPGLIGDFTDSTSVTGNGNLPSYNPIANAPYNDPRNDQFGHSQDLSGGFDWRSLLMGGNPPGGQASRPGGSSNGSGGGSTGLLGALLPLLMHLLTGGSHSPTGAEQQQQAQLQAMNQLLMEKAQRQAPVHQAAMNMAMRMAPNGGSSPQMDQTIQQAAQPRPQLEQDPQVLDAIHRLMGSPR